MLDSLKTLFHWFTPTSGIKFKAMIKFIRKSVFALDCIEGTQVYNMSGVFVHFEELLNTLRCLNNFLPLINFLVFF